MIKFKVKFNDAKEVAEFANAVSKLECEADLGTGRHLIPAISIMSIYSFGISNEFDMIIYSDDKDLKYMFNKWRII